MTAQQVARLVASSTADAHATARIVTASLPRLIVRDRQGTLVVMTDDISYALAARKQTSGHIADRWSWR